MKDVGVAIDNAFGEDVEGTESIDIVHVEKKPSTSIKVNIGLRKPHFAAGLMTIR